MLRYRDERLARYVRQRCYKAREQARTKNSPQFDSLSLLVTSEGNLKIIKRNALRYGEEDNLEKPYVELLKASELPEYVGSRGKAQKTDMQKQAFLGSSKHF